MTPLASTPLSVAAPQAPARARGAGGSETPETSFAQALEQGRAGAATADTTRAVTGDAIDTPAAPEADDPQGVNRPHADANEAVETAGSADPAALAWAATAALLASGLPWPPAGLAGLRLSGGGDALHAAAPDDARGPLLSGSILMDAGRTGALAPDSIAAQAASAIPLQSAPPEPVATAPGAPLVTLKAPATPQAGAAVPSTEASLPAALPDAVGAAAPAGGENAGTPIDRIDTQAAFSLPGLAGAPPSSTREAVPVLAPPPGLPTPDLRGQDFSERFGAQLQWMAGQDIGHARIRVSPQELGPVEVMLRLDGDRISADFISAHAETRQALEQGLPRLRDLLGEHGFQLAHADVGSQGSSPQRDEAGTSGAVAGSTGDGGGSEASTEPAGAPPQRVMRGLLDAYA